MIRKSVIDNALNLAVGSITEWNAHKVRGAVGVRKYKKPFASCFCGIVRCIVSVDIIHVEIEHAKGIAHFQRYAPLGRSWKLTLWLPVYDLGAW